MNVHTRIAPQSLPAEPAQHWDGTCYELTVVVPTLNEAENIAPLYQALCAALDGIDWEVVFVDDDSVDATVTEVRRIAACDRRVRVMRRIGRRGLSGAVLEGILSSSAFAVAVIDADMQHDERLLTAMLRRIRDGDDLVIGSRHIAGGSAAGGFSRRRAGGSVLATTLARVVLRAEITDPMSGYFMVRRAQAERLAPRLSSQGFKILLDLMASADRPMRISELPYQFRARERGVSKLDASVVLDFLGLLVAKLSRDLVSIRFVMFALVGATGLLVHMLALKAGLDAAGLGFEPAQLSAAFIAMTWNFALNNAFTYRDRRLKGWRLVTGLLSFCAVCSIGAIANVGVASWVYGNEPVWWIAGAAGALMGAVFNYSASSAFTWRR
jgi:dolichol-phosphate mannosyltransferase